MSSMWFVSVVALLVVDVRTGALEQDIQPHRCHQCFPTNTTSCQHSEEGWLSATCPSARPYCATAAIGPDFGTSLGCAAAAATPCSLANSPRQILELTCICVGHLCNAPFSLELRNELLNFSSADNNSALAEAFFNLSKFANVSDAALYKTITVEVDVLNSSVTTEGGSLSAMPKAEALKQQTAPSDDDEDESEGSGAYEDSKLHIQGQSASAPAAPSSYLPAENTACSLTILLAPLAFIHLVF